MKAKVCMWQAGFCARRHRRQFQCGAIIGLSYIIVSLTLVTAKSHRDLSPKRDNFNRHQVNDHDRVISEGQERGFGSLFVVSNQANSGDSDLSSTDWHPWRPVERRKFSSERPQPYSTHLFADVKDASRIDQHVQQTPNNRIDQTRHREIIEKNDRTIKDHSKKIEGSEQQEDESDKKDSSKREPHRKQQQQIDEKLVVKSPTQSQDKPLYVGNDPPSAHLPASTLPAHLTDQKHHSGWIVRMMTPQVTQSKNKTLTDELVKFKRAPSEQMTKHDGLETKITQNTAQFISSTTQIQGKRSENLMVGPVVADVMNSKSGKIGGDNMSPHDGWRRSLAKRDANSSLSLGRVSRYERSTLEPEDKLMVAHKSSRHLSRPIGSSNKSSVGVVDLVKAPSMRNTLVEKDDNLRDSPVGSIRPLPKTASTLDSEKDTFLASASQGSPISAAADDEDEEDDNEESDHSPSSSESSSSSSDEPPASASGDSGDSSGDENDYTNGSDDFDDSSGFDSDDEPFNQVASSERNNDYSSFDIPQIDINPDTLRQKGCKTVLREVQEIPMNGLGVVNSNGQAGAGYGAESQVAGLRVKRASNNDNLINSRKVTSIVMTKECHFPDELSTHHKRPPKTQKQQKLKPNQIRPMGNGPVRNQMIVGPVEFGNHGGASHVKTLLAKPKLTPMNKSQPTVQQQPVYQTTLVEATHADRPLDRPQVVARFYNLHPYSAGFGQPVFAYQAAPTNQHSSQNPAKYSVTRGKESAVAKRPVARNQTPAPGAQTTPQSTIKRRSIISPPKPQLAIPAVQLLQQFSKHPRIIQSATRVQSKNESSAHKIKMQDQEINEGAASGVVARKLYKPPSEDDPYHTLSYSSQTGADPDMEQDDDDGVVMGPDSDDPAPVSSRSDQRYSNALSEKERAALSDPNYDDSDSSDSGGEKLSSSNQSTEPDYMGERSRDVDESDGDLTDESRYNGRLAPVNRRQAVVPGNSELLKRQFFGSPGNSAPKPRSDGPSQRKHKSIPTGSNRLEMQVGIGIKPQDKRFGKAFKFEHELGRRVSTNPASLSSQIGSLPAGKLHGFVAIKAEPNPGQSAQGGPHNQRQMLRQSMVETSRRQDDDDDDDDNDDDDDGGGGGGGSGQGRKKGRGNQMAASAPSGEDVDSAEPDADPEYNPNESRVPAHTKPKRFEKSFAYVHRDLPKKGAPNPDDFVVSYGRGNVQTEHEDYDSDKDNNPQDDRRRAAAAAAAASHKHEVRILMPGGGAKGPL